MSHAPWDPRRHLGPLCTPSDTWATSPCAKVSFLLVVLVHWGPNPYGSLPAAQEPLFKSQKSFLHCIQTSSRHKDLP